MRRQALRTIAGTAGHAGRTLRAHVAHQGGRGELASAAAAELAVRDRDHRALPTSREQRGRGLGRDVSSGRVGPPGGGHYRGSVGYAGESQRGQRTESEDLRADRRVAEPADRGPARLCVLGRHLAKAFVGRRSEKRGSAGGHRRARGRLSAQILGVVEGLKEDTESYATSCGI